MLNPFMVAGAALCLCAGLWSHWHADHQMGIIYLAWGVADLAAAFRG